MGVTITNQKPNVFIGCSREAIDYARAVNAQLERFVQVNPWYAGTFGANAYTMEALEQELASNDFGVFIFAPDDVALIRGKYVFVTRDNTLFEMGLFWGRLGRKRVFAIVPREVQERSDFVPGETVSQFHIVSDLSGLTLLEYGMRSDSKYQAAVDTACGEIRSAIEREGMYANPLERLEQQRAMLEQKDSVLNFFYEYNRNVNGRDPLQRYSALAEAVRNSLLSPTGYRVMGAGIWKKTDDQKISQVGGNVGRGKSFLLTENEGLTNEGSRKIVVDVFHNRGWSVFKKRQFADILVLCYYLGNEQVLSVHFSGNRTLDEAELQDVVRVNEDLLVVLRDFVGGDS
ncbi:MAG: nucleotide-binding protein [Paenibacillus sp.]|nr:nucleotide-binding protein [Paenibacillus sp.]